MSQAGREIELKFLCAPEDLEAVLAAAPPGEDAVRELTAVYFDTPDGALERAGVSLRVRHDGQLHVQTLKRGKGVSREEHESVVTGPNLDLAMPALREVLGEEQRAALAAVSHVRLTRRQRLVRFDGAEIEIAADVGETTAGGRSDAISELELELKSGPETALHALAQDLSKVVALMPSTLSKAARGRALRRT